MVECSESGPRARAELAPGDSPAALMCCVGGLSCELAA